MNDKVQKLYNDYLTMTGQNETAAASLTLADTMQSMQDHVTPAHGVPMTVPEVAKFLRVRPDKVLGWIRSGELAGCPDTLSLSLRA